MHVFQGEYYCTLKYYLKQILIDRFPAQTNKLCSQNILSYLQHFTISITYENSIIIAHVVLRCLHSYHNNTAK